MQLQLLEPQEESTAEAKLTKKIHALYKREQGGLRGFFDRLLKRDHENIQSIDRVSQTVLNKFGRVRSLNSQSQVIREKD